MTFCSNAPTTTAADAGAATDTLNRFLELPAGR
jgi:hypothetical protein